jgi:hypothetical protein
VKINRKVITEAHRRENGSDTLNANNKTKVTWQIINKEIHKLTVNNKKTETHWRSDKINKSKIVADLFKSYLIEIVQKLTE